MLAKIARPRLALAYQRIELHQTLDDMRARPVVVVSGPPGAGKSTLVATYIENRNIPCLWYQVDKGDQDLASFFYYLSLAASEINPGVKSSLPHFTPEVALGVSTFSRGYFRSLYSNLQTPFLIVFDDYQEISGDAALHEVIRDACLEVPPGGRIALISRNECPPVMTRLRANNLITTIEWKDLRLNPSEVKAIAAMHGLTLPSEEMVDALHAKVNGWVAGLSLILQMRDHANSANELPDATSAMMFDYFAEEVFKGLPPDVQDVMQKAAVLPVMTPSHVEELLESPDASRMLAQFAQSNYFTIKLGDRIPVYQYHPLFREFLLGRAEASLPPATLMALRRHAAAILVKAGQMEEGMQLFLKIKDWGSIANLVCQHGRKLFEQARHKTLETWIRHLPEEMVDAVPWLSYWLGASLVFYNPAASRPYFERAHTLFRNENNLPGILLSWAGVMDAIFYSYCDLKEADLWIDEMDTLLAKYPDMPSPEIAGRVTFTMFTVLTFRNPNHPRIPFWEERVALMIDSNIDSTVRALLALHLSSYQLWRGKIAQSGITLEVITGQLDKITLTPFAQIMWHLAEASYAMHAGLHQRCLRAVKQGLSISNETGIHMWDMVLCGHGATTSFSLNNLDAADEYVGTMASRYDINRATDASHYHVMAAYQAALKNQSGPALEHAKLAIRLVEKSGKPYFIAAGLFGSALVHYWCKDTETAEAYLQQARKIGKEIDNLLLEWVYLLFAAYLAIDQGKKEAGLGLVREAFRLGRENSYMHFFFWPRAAISTLCGVALHEGIEDSYALQLIKFHSMTPELSASISGKWPYPIKIYTLGRFNVVKNESPIRFDGKAQSAPIKLLKVLIALGGRDVSEHRLTAALWPDADGDAAQQTLSTTLFRLRKLIGNDAIKRQEGRIGLDPLMVWVDCWSAERILSSHFSKQISQSKTLFDLYQKPFLYSEEDASWALPLREKLHRKFIQYVSSCGKELERLGQHEEAISFYQRGLGIDDLAEDFYKGLMSSYVATGRKAESIRLYDLANQIFLANLGIELSAEFKSIYQSLW